MTDIRTAVYDLLRTHDMRRMFGNPGSNELPFLQDFPNDFQYILGLHEGVVVGMADGYAQASGKPVFVSVHAAAGSGNSMGALTNAWYAHSPLVVMAGQQVRSMIGLEPMLCNVDATELPKPLVKWSCEPRSAIDVPRAVSEAILRATTPAKAPVYLSIPYDDWDRPAEPNAIQFLGARSVTVPGMLSNEQLAMLAKRINDARSPMFIVGSEVDAEGVNAQVVTLAERLKAPVWLAPSLGRLPFPNKHPNFQGYLPAAIDAICGHMKGHDLVVVLGAPVFRYHEYKPAAYLPEGTELVHLTADAGDAARTPMGSSWVCNVGATIRGLVDLVKERKGSGPARKLAPQPVADKPGAMSPETVFDVIAQVAPKDAIYIDESTATRIQLLDRLDMSLPGSYFYSPAGGLGSGTPAAIGVQMAQPERRVIAIIGDGSANFGITALWSAARYKVPVTYIIMKNGTYSALRWFTHVLDIKSAPGLDIPNIDFVSIAKGYGVNAHAVDNPEALAKALKSALAGNAPTLIEASTYSHD